MTHICKQPNGKYCIFSTVTDSLMCINMTMEDFYNHTTERTQREFDNSDFENATPLFEHIKRICYTDEVTADTLDMLQSDFDELLQKINDKDGKFEKLYTAVEW